MKNVTLFTCPKPFSDPHINIIQRNAIRSWMQFADQVEIFLVGEEEGVAEVAGEYGITHLPDVERNKWGTPRVDSVFELAQNATEDEIVVYLNADIILLPSFIKIIRDIYMLDETFLIVGRRWDVNIRRYIEFDSFWADRLEQLVKKQGKLRGHSAMDFFGFPTGMYQNIPSFAIGRAGWDNWMIFHAIEKGWKVVDITPTVIVIHQNHSYDHLPGGKTHLNLDESHENVKLGGGFDKLYDLLDVEYQYEDGKITIKPMTLPRFLRRLERFFMPGQKAGWRWKCTQVIRRLRKRITY